MAPDAPTERELAAEFQGVTDAEILRRCRDLCEGFRMSATQLSTQWDLLQLDGTTKGAMTLDSFSILERTVREQQSRKQPRVAKEPKTASAARHAMAPSTFTKDSAHLLQLGAVMGGATTGCLSWPRAVESAWKLSVPFSTSARSCSPTNFERQHGAEPSSILASRK